jgi:hypothetical protein
MFRNLFRTSRPLNPPQRETRDPVANRVVSMLFRAFGCVATASIFWSPYYPLPEDWLWMEQEDVLSRESEPEKMDAEVA